MAQTFKEKLAELEAKRRLDLTQNKQKDATQGSDISESVHISHASDGSVVKNKQKSKLFWIDSQ